MRILVAQSEPLLAKQIETLLSSQGFLVDLAPDGSEAQYRGQTEPYDVIILDQDLPIKDGLSVFKTLRADGLGTPILMLTPYGQPVQFEIAPDAYLIKSLHMPELVSQVQALIDLKADQAGHVFAKNHVSFDSVAGQVSVAGDQVPLTVQETTILDYLFHNAGRFVSKDELSTRLYAGHDDRPSNTIAVFVNRLRKKLGDDVIDTVRGRGYIIKGAL